MKYDVAVVGGGPGGYVAAITAAQKGLKTILIEKDKAGGTCLNRGCIPTKALLHCVGQYEAAQNGARFGLDVTVNGFDYKKAFAHKEEVVSKLTRGVEALVKGNKATYKTASAKLKDSHTLTLSDGEEVEFEYLIIATGSYPAPAPFKADEGCKVINSDEFLKLDEMPDSLVVCGGGVIGIEFATVLAGMGKKVYVAEAMTQILPNMDAELAAYTQKVLEKKGVEFHLGTFVTKVSNKDGKSVCTLKKGEEISEIEADMVLCAIGRRADSASIAPEAVGLNTNRGFITVDEYCRTNIPNIFAIGDVNGRSMLAHSASSQGRTVAEGIAKGKMKICDFRIIPGCVYTEPEIASVGMTEADAVKAGYEVKVGRFDASGNGKLMAMGANEGFSKMVTDKKTGEILGVQLCMPHATDIIAEAALAMKLECTAEEVGETIHPHPTVSEIFMETADDCNNSCAHKIYR